MKGKTFGAVTIGQAPRQDVTPEILHILGEGYQVMEAGALDGLSPAEIAALTPLAGEEVLVTRLLDGSAVQVAARHIVPRVQAQVTGLFAQGLPLVVLLCTGVFPPFQVPGPLLRPQEILYQTAASLGHGLRVGVLTPTPAHIPQVSRDWTQVLGAPPVVIPATPYAGMGALEDAARQLKAARVQLTVLDCIGYNLEMQAHVRAVTGAPVLLARGLVARVVKELLG
ncbi:MAG: AroM family protein [Anaerolineales bacterium]